jgi:YD repeat-containing protein
MATVTFDLWAVYKAAPISWGSVQDTTGLGYVYNASPFLVASEPKPGTHYTYDSLSRLTIATFLPQGSFETYNYDPDGNRTSVVITAGPGGL